MNDVSSLRLRRRRMGMKSVDVNKELLRNLGTPLPEQVAIRAAMKTAGIPMDGEQAERAERLSERVRELSGPEK